MIFSVSPWLGLMSKYEIVHVDLNSEMSNYGAIGGCQDYGDMSGHCLVLGKILSPLVKK